nr:MAG TPA: Rad50 zinc hook motif [Caudoviricetes sp.]
MGYYRTCPWCGSNLDPAERCECRQRAEEQRHKILALFEQGEDGQIAMRLEEKANGA